VSKVLNPRNLAVKYVDDMDYETEIAMESEKEAKFWQLLFLITITLSVVIGSLLYFTTI